MKADLVLIHAPSVYDFREHSIMYGPVSDLVPSSPVFEMYPIGFTTIAEYLERNGFRVRIVNLAVRMLEDPQFDVPRFLGKIDAEAFGIDLHWLPHAHGSLEIARIIKQKHPETSIIMGGLSATYYCREILKNHHDIDYIVRGDSTEESCLELMNAITSRGRRRSGGKNTIVSTIRSCEHLEAIPNLAWRDENGLVRETPIKNIPDTLDHLMTDYSIVVKSVLRHGDFASVKPVKDWFRYPITGLCHMRGCTQNCVTCGGSAYAYRRFYCREKTAFSSPRKVVDDITAIGSFTKGPIYVIGDLRARGIKGAYSILKELRKEKIQNRIVFELFEPADKAYIEAISRSAENFAVTISPDSHDEKIRFRQGRRYSTNALEDTVAHALQYGAEKFDMYFMIGLPGQDYNSAVGDVEYAARLIRKFGSRQGAKEKLHAFTSPLAPFVDPGSIAFEEPEKLGYRLFCRNFTGHRERLTEPSWKYILNYETSWMSRDEIVAATYESALHLNRMREEFGITTCAEYREIERRIRMAVRIMKAVDRVVSAKQMKNSPEDLKDELMVRDEIDSLNTEILCPKRELEWKSGGVRLNVKKYAKLLIESLTGKN